MRLLRYCELSLARRSGASLHQLAEVPGLGRTTVTIDVEADQSQR